ncbi:MULTISPECIES: helix-turn-helix transcriptional regulator [Streptomyces]|uniref:helix-turn-helix transcriptional regulator n=1 Tax=Streptomyces TaxID=1883 RepID=UPI00163D15E2|nr:MULTISPECIES: LuxR family transcriptional regulator [Streptomyces]MBC2874583.1 AAA family ATPase [Streptomyces sp. TYQ1024]
MLGDVQKTSVSPVFVGRTEELGVLADALARAATGEPQSVLVGGEAGVGKTRLIDEFLAAAGAAGAVTALGGCVEIGSDGLPFAPVSTALRGLHRQLGDELTRAAAGQEGELARLLPELGETARESEDGRARLFELTARLLERLTTDRTIVLAIEDLHWADRSTRELLSYLFRSLHTARLVIVATYRSDDIHRRHPLRPFLAEADRMRALGRVELSRFTRDEVHAQLTGISGDAPDHTLLDRVFERSDGNAFFVEELAASIAGGCRSGLSDSLRELLLVRIEALGEDAQRVVRVAAVGGSTVEYALLRAVAGLDEDALIQALRQAVGASVLVPTSDGDGYRFRHSLAREAVADDLLPGECSRLQRRYAEALEAQPGLVRADELPARLALHWYHAHEPAKALPAVLEASVHARRRYAYAEKLRLLERALELWEDAPEEVRAVQRPLDFADVYPACGCDDDGLHHIDLLAEIVVAANLSGDQERALAIAKKALRKLEMDPLRGAWFWLQRSKLMTGLGRGDGRPELDTALELVADLPPSAVHAEVLAQLAGWAALHDPGPELSATAERAIAMARAVGAESTELSARLTLAGHQVDTGTDVDGGLAEMAEVCARVVAGGVVGVVGRSHINLASALQGVGRSARAAEVAREGIALADRYCLDDARAWARNNLASALFVLGRWDEAERAAEEARREARGIKPGGFADVRLAAIALARGDLERAERLLATARERFGTHDPQPQSTLVLARYAIELSAARGRYAEARAELERVLAEGLPRGAHRYVWPFLASAAAAEADARELPETAAGRAAALDGLRAAAEGRSRAIPLRRAFGLLFDAELARADGISDAGRWEAAAGAFEPLDRPLELARARHRWAEALLTEGGPAAEHAAGLLARAHAEAVRLGARPLREATASLARRARLPLAGEPATDGRTPAPEAGTGADAPPRLTPREHDVLRLVTLGRSNRQIAEELFISPKTASVHVSNILAKLGAAGRGEAAATAHRLGLFGPSELGSSAPGPSAAGPTAVSPSAVSPSAVG